ncbi:hypothetical protein [Oceanobacillus halophilus]|uniref:Uncharacterized protein n=1 Tax=Oceanobacillus halophilus TaxID=930130 RepID=A0A495AB75_9BACI|nr:hypothetical protein [Oceanobacillus halophilus]RKQ37289.1 hypothetical protein D8M06_00335 [Oceanobacillus halophilus]
MYYYYYPMYYPNYYPNYIPVRQYPPVNPDLFHQSANEMRMLMNDASIVLDRLADSTEFDEAVMSAAQESNKEEVKRLIQSTGISSNVDISFNPDNIRMVFNSKVDDSDCCRLEVSIRWR